jgi:hypothetical protein
VSSPLVPLLVAIFRSRSVRMLSLRPPIEALLHSVG